MSEDAIRQKELFRFLKWLREEYGPEVELSYINYARYIPDAHRYYVSGAFSWDNSDEGFDFWHNISNAWVKYISQLPQFIDIETFNKLREGRNVQAKGR